MTSDVGDECQKFMRVQMNAARVSQGTERHLGNKTVIYNS